MKLRTKFILTLILLALVPLFAMIWVNFSSSRETVIKQNISTLEAIADSRVEAIRAYFYSWEVNIKILQNDKEFHQNLLELLWNNDRLNPPSKKMAEQLDVHTQSWSSQSEDVSDVLLVSKTGQVIYAISQEGSALIGEPFFDPTGAVLSSSRQGIFISDLFVGKNQKRKMYIANPVLDSNLEFAGTFIIEIDSFRLDEIIQNTIGLGQTGETFIGQLVSDDNSSCGIESISAQAGDHVLFLSELRFDSEAAFERSIEFCEGIAELPIQKAVLGKSGSGLSLDYRGEEVIAVWRYLPIRNWGLVTKMNLDEVLEPVYIFGYTLLFLLLIITLILLISIWIVSGYAIRFIHQIEQAKNKSEAILQGIGDAVFVVNKDLIIEQINQAASDLVGVPIEKAIGKPYKHVMRFFCERTGKENDCFIVETLKTGVSQPMENHTLLVRNDGTKISISDSASPVKNHFGDVMGVVVVFRDVTEERQVDRMKTEFISLASHQLRTPLTGIKWATELMLNQQENLSTAQIDYLSRIHDSEEHLVDLVNGLLNVSRLESGTLKIHPVPIDLRNLIESVGKDFSLVAEKNQIHFVTHVPETPLVVPIDTDIFAVIIQNLVSNALKYTLQQGKVTLNLLKTNKEFILSISDSGIGIPLKQQHRIFEKFFRAENAVILSIEGTGLGLYVTKTVVEQAGGSLTFVSKENQGSTFEVRFPLAGMRAKKGVNKPKTINLVT